MDQNLKSDADTLTKTLCGHLAAAEFGDLTAAAVSEARRGVLDWIGCALAGKRASDHHDARRRPGGHFRPAAGNRVRAQPAARPHRDAALANGQMGHVLDYDDTHMGGVVLHTSSPVLAAAVRARRTRAGARPPTSCWLMR